MTTRLNDEFGRIIVALLNARNADKPAIASKITERSNGLANNDRATLLAAALQQLVKFTRDTGYQCTLNVPFLGTVFILTVVLVITGLLWWAALPPLLAAGAVLAVHRQRSHYLCDITLLCGILSTGEEPHADTMTLQETANSVLRMGLVYATEVLCGVSGIALLVAAGVHALATTTFAIPALAPGLAWSGFGLILVSTMLTYSMKLRLNMVN